MDKPIEYLMLGMGALVVGAILTAVFGRSWRISGWIAMLATAVAGVFVWRASLKVFLLGPSESGSLWEMSRMGLSGLKASLQFRIDGLSAAFLCIISLTAFCAILYAMRYMEHRYERGAGLFYPFQLLLLASVLGVLASSDMFFFLIFWEFMSLAAYAGIVFDRESESSLRAGIRYFVITHIATACMIFGAIMLYMRGGDFSFSTMAMALSQFFAQSPLLAHLALLLFLIGFGTKAGMFPLGGWLPDAYPAAPSPATALFAGSMTKLGIYGIIRIFIGFLTAFGLEKAGIGEACQIWGCVIAILGTASIFIGTLSALNQDEGKRLLSFHIIGQIGYMLLAAGIAVFFIKINPILSMLALIASIYHLVNNMTYKSLLFLNVGAAEYATGTTNLNKMGGLSRIMPLTAVTAVIASLSIAGVPPFNGFASKWLIYHVSLEGGLRIWVFLGLGIVAMFISIVTLASFMKLLGAAFLGELSTNGAKPHGETPATMVIAQGLLALVCIIFGVLPVVPLMGLYPAACSVMPYVPPSYTDLFGANLMGLTLRFGDRLVGVWNPVLALMALLACGVISYIIFRLGAAPVRETANWYCGEEYDPELVRFRAHGFVQPFKKAFSDIYPHFGVPRAQVPEFLRKIFDIDSWLYSPIVRSGANLTEKFSHTHSGLPQLYMLWQIAGVVLVITALLLILR